MRKSLALFSIENNNIINKYIYLSPEHGRDRGRTGQAKGAENQNPQETPKTEKDTPDSRFRVAQHMHSPVWEQYHCFGNSTTKPVRVPLYWEKEK